MINMKHGRGPAAAGIRVIFLFTAVSLAGCDPVSLTVLGVGSAAGVQHTLSGIAYKTFTMPWPKVRSAVQTALSRMSIDATRPQKIENGEVIKARAADRDIEIELEAVTASTTRMRSVVHKGVLMDAATATEIIVQTERVAGAG